MTPEELAHLLLTSLLAALCDELLNHHKHHLRKGAKYIHRNMLHWAPSAQEQTDEMGD